MQYHGHCEVYKNQKRVIITCVGLRKRGLIKTVDHNPTIRTKRWTDSRDKSLEDMSQLCKQTGFGVIEE